MEKKLIQAIKNSTDNWEQLPASFLVYDKKDQIIMQIWDDIFIIRACNIFRCSFMLDSITNIIDQDSHDSLYIEMGQNSISINL